GRHHNRPVSEAHDDGRHRDVAYVSLRARLAARRRDAHGAALRAEPDRRAARRMARARDAEGEGAVAAEVAAPEIAAACGAAAGVRGGFRRAPRRAEV